MMPGAKIAAYDSLWGIPNASTSLAERALERSAFDCYRIEFGRLFFYSLPKKRFKLYAHVCPTVGSFFLLTFTSGELVEHEHLG